MSRVKRKMQSQGKQDRTQSITCVSACAVKKTVGFSFKIFLWTNIRMLGHSFMPYLIVNLKPAVIRTWFAWPFANEEVESQKKNAIPEKTRQDTEYYLCLFNHWRESWIQTMGVSIPMLSERYCSSHSGCCASSLKPRRRIVLFQSTALYHIVAGLMFHLPLNGKPEIDLFKDSSFVELRMTIDVEMKRLKAFRESSKWKQAVPISVEEEEQLR